MVVVYSKASNRGLDLWQEVVGFLFLRELNHMESINSIQVPLFVPPGTKLLRTFEAEGRYRAEPMPEGAPVIAVRQIAEANGHIRAKPAGKEFRL
jgi:hypothetical protein